MLFPEGKRYHIYSFIRRMEGVGWPPKKYQILLCNSAFDHNTFGHKTEYAVLTLLYTILVFLSAIGLKDTFLNNKVSCISK